MVNLQRCRFAKGKTIVLAMVLGCGLRLLSQSAATTEFISFQAAHFSRTIVFVRDEKHETYFSGRAVVCEIRRFLSAAWSRSPGREAVGMNGSG